MNQNDKFHNDISPELNDDELDSVAGGSGDGSSYAYSVGTRVVFALGCLGRCMGSGGTILSRYTNENTSINPYWKMYRVKCEYCGHEDNYTETTIHT